MRNAAFCLPTGSGCEEYVPSPRAQSTSMRWRTSFSCCCDCGNTQLLTWYWSQAPEMQTMYSMPMPVSAIRTRIRQEFERHRYANKLPLVDVLLFKSHAEYQVRATPMGVTKGGILTKGLAGDDELLETDDPRHVILQGGELPRRQKTTVELHDGLPGGEFARNHISESELTEHA